MKRLITAFGGVCLCLICCVVPSFALDIPTVFFPGSSTFAYSSTPVYPSGSLYNFFTGLSPSSSASSSTSDFFVAVASGLANGFNMVSKGLYNLQTNTKASSDTLSALRTYLFGVRDNRFRALNGIGSGLSAYDTSSSIQGGALGQINDNLYYGFQTLFSGLGRINTNISTMDGNITSGFSTLGAKLDSHSSDLMTWLHTLDSSPAGLHFPVYDEYGNRVDFPATYGGWLDLFANYHFYNNELLASLVRLTYSPEDEKLKDKTEDQKNELLDNFFGDGSDGVQSGQIGSMGDISSSAGGLLDSGGKVENVFSEIGNSGSSVWSWFSQDNSNAINGVGGAARVAAEDPDVSPSPEIVDFYGAQRDEFLSMLGGG